MFAGVVYLIVIWGSDKFGDNERRLIFVGPVEPVSPTVYVILEGSWTGPIIPVNEEIGILDTDGSVLSLKFKYKTNPPDPGVPCAPVGPV